MRRSEITPELIELSKRAKELGFPQEIHRGDWIFVEYGLPIATLVDVVDMMQEYLDGIKEKNWFLILSFSRCLEWLRERRYILRLPYQKDLMKKAIELLTRFDGGFLRSEICIKGNLFMENPDLWIAKAVVKILEEEE